MKKFFSIMTAFTLLILWCLPLIACGDGGGSDEDVYYTVTYDLNYEGSTPRTVEVKAGTRASRYNATRSGYTLEDWYNTAECIDGDTFDFTQYITKDTTIYAKWTADAAMISVTFDANYEGGTATTVFVEEGSLISDTIIPACSKLGMQYEGWYTDSDCTQAWDLATDIVAESITLYAKYELDESVSRDEQGNIVYENVTITLFTGGNVFDTTDILNELVQSFNAEYAGKIQVNVTSTVSSSTQSYYALRYQQIPGANEDIETNYYSAQDVYEFAGIEWDASDWYENASRDSYVGGKLYSIPIAAGVPYIIYNKDLMSKYNTEDMTLDSYADFSSLLSAVYTGESVLNTGFKTILTGTDWPFREGVSYAAFLQNDADYYVYENGEYVNKWGEAGSATYQNAVNALTNIYNLFGVNGTLHGGTTEDSYIDNLAIGEVASGNAFMCIANVPKSIESMLANTSGNLGYMPLSGLFAEEGSTQSAQIPVHTVGFQFYKASNVSLTQLAACAVFANYVSQNSYVYAENGWYPMRKEIVENDTFQNSTDATVTVLKGIGDPENFRTLDGFRNEKYIFNKVVAEGYILNMLAQEETGDTYFTGQIELLLSEIINALR